MLFLDMSAPYDRLKAQVRLTGDLKKDKKCGCFYVPEQKSTFLSLWVQTGSTVTLYDTISTVRESFLFQFLVDRCTIFAGV